MKINFFAYSIALHVPGFESIIVALEIAFNSKSLIVLSTVSSEKKIICIYYYVEHFINKKMSHNIIIYIKIL